ncbi:MAG: hypothetical protein AAF570_18275, partial [Bacteroidota bacterium]
QILALRADNLERILICFSPDETQLRNFDLGTVRALDGKRSRELEFQASIRSLDIVILMLRDDHKTATHLTLDALSTLPKNFRENSKLLFRLLLCMQYFAQDHFDLLDAELHNFRRKLRQFPAEEALLLTYIRLFQRLAGSLEPRTEIQAFLDTPPGALTGYQRTNRMILNRVLQALAR